jgi:uncharacterized membrane protein
MQWLRVFLYEVSGIDALHACLALGPLAVYLLLIGVINLSRRPFLVSGNRDAAALGLALSGLVIIGPIELCLPTAAVARFGPIAWVLMVVVYVLCLILVLLLLSPRLVIYNVAADQLRAVLADLAGRLDSEARWARDVLVLPTLGVQLHLDTCRSMRNVSLSSVGRSQNPLGWQRLESALGVALGRASTARGARGVLLVAVAVLMVFGLGYAVASDPQAVAEAFFDMLRL